LMARSDEVGLIESSLLRRCQMVGSGGDSGVVDEVADGGSGGRLRSRGLWLSDTFAAACLHGQW
jgi:hypothetical protein